MAEGKEYLTENIRNVAVLGHGGSGKTMLVDALAFVGGTARRKGNVAEGHALTMTAPEEIQRIGKAIHDAGMVVSMVTCDFFVPQNDEN